MRRFFGKLVNGRRGNNAKAAKRGPRRASLQVEGLESRELLSAAPLLHSVLDPVHIGHPPFGGFGYYDCIQIKYQSLGGPNGFLGSPVTGEMALSTQDGNGLYELFQHGAIFFSPATGAHEIHGAIE